MKTQLLVQFLINGLIIGTLYGMVAMCFVLVFKASRAVNFAQGEFLLVGAWLCWGFMHQLHVPLWAGFLLTATARQLCRSAVNPADSGGAVLHLRQNGRGHAPGLDFIDRHDHHLCCIA